MIDRKNNVSVVHLIFVCVFLIFKVSNSLDGVKGRDLNQDQSNSDILINEPLPFPILTP